MNTIFTTDKNGKKRYLDIRVEEINDVWCIVKATGQVGGKEAKSITEVPIGYESALKRAKASLSSVSVSNWYLGILESSA